MADETAETAVSPQTGLEAPLAPPSPPSRRLRIVFIVAVEFIGICEALTVTPWITWDRVPDVLALPISMIGFAAFIVLFGPFGNAAAAVGVFLLARRRWGWTPWRCLAMAAPFAYVILQMIPSPW